MGGNLVVLHVHLLRGQSVSCTAFSEHATCNAPIGSGPWGSMLKDRQVDMQHCFDKTLATGRAAQLRFWMHNHAEQVCSQQVFRTNCNPHHLHQVVVGVVLGHKPPVLGKSVKGTACIKGGQAACEPPNAHYAFADALPDEPLRLCPLTVGSPVALLLCCIAVQPADCCFL